MSIEIEYILVGARFVQYAAAMVFLGSSAFPFYALSHKSQARLKEIALRHVGKLSLGLSLLVLTSALVWLGCETVLMSGKSLAYKDKDLIRTVLENSQFGHIWSLRLIVSIVALLNFVAVWLTGISRKGLVLQGKFGALMGFFLVGSLGGIGHGAIGIGHDPLTHIDNQILHMLNQSLHLIAAALWIGGLVSLAYLLKVAPATGDWTALLGTSLRRFSTVGILAVLVIIGSGMINAFFLVGSWLALTSSFYGQILCVKLTLFFLLLCFAVLNRARLMPKLERFPHDHQTFGKLVRSVASEQVLAVMILALVSYLGTLPPPFGMAHMSM